MTKQPLSCFLIVAILSLAGCGDGSSPDGATAGSSTTVAISAADQLRIDAYGANVVVSDFCGAVVNDSNPRDVRALSHAVDTLIDFHRSANNDESRGLLRDAAAMLRDCSDFARDRVGLDAADRLTAAVDG